MVQNAHRSSAEHIDHRAINLAEMKRNNSFTGFEKSWPTFRSPMTVTLAEKVGFASTNIVRRKLTILAADVVDRTRSIGPCHATDLGRDGSRVRCPAGRHLVVAEQMCGCRRHGGQRPCQCQNDPRPHEHR